MRAAICFALLDPLCFARPLCSAPAPPARSTSPPSAPAPPQPRPTPPSPDASMDIAASADGPRLWALAESRALVTVLWSKRAAFDAAKTHARQFHLYNEVAGELPLHFPCFPKRSGTDCMVQLRTLLTEYYELGTAAPFLQHPGPTRREHASAASTPSPRRPGRHPAVSGCGGNIRPPRAHGRNSCCYHLNLPPPGSSSERRGGPPSPGPRGEEHRQENPGMSPATSTYFFFS